MFVNSWPWQNSFPTQSAFIQVNIAPLVLEHDMGTGDVDELQDGGVTLLLRLEGHALLA